MYHYGKIKQRICRFSDPQSIFLISLKKNLVKEYLPKWFIQKLVVKQHGSSQSLWRLLLHTIRYWAPTWNFHCQVIIFKKHCILLSEDLFYLYKQCRPWWNAALCCISSGSSLFEKVHVKAFLWIQGYGLWYDFFFFKILYHFSKQCRPISAGFWKLGAQWLSGRVLDSRLRFKPHQ